MWFIPLLSKVLDIPGAIAAYFNKKQDVDLEKYKVKGGIDVEAMRQDTAIIQARADLAKAMKGDPATSFGRLLFIGSVGGYTAVYFYYLTFYNLLPDYLIWEPLAIPETLQYMPYAVVAYLFVTSFKK
jgi:hypothetical protein